MFASRRYLKNIFQNRVQLFQDRREGKANQIKESVSIQQKGSAPDTQGRKRPIPHVHRNGEKSQLSASDQVSKEGHRMALKT